MTTNLDAALAYAAQGWHVFPVAPYRPGVVVGSDEYKAAKRPVTWLVRRGHHDATTDPEKIRAWWARVSRARIGLACKPSGILVIDHDDYKDNAAQLPDLPETVTSWTPQGGRHYFFRYPEGEWTDKREHGLDTKANGYVILPSPDSGGYCWGEPSTWEWDGPPASAPVALPEELQDFLLQRDDPGPGPQTIREVEDRERFLIEEVQLRALGEYRVKGEDAKGRIIVELETCPFDTHSENWKAVIGIGSKGEPFAMCVKAGCAGKRWQDLPAPDYSQLTWEEVRVPIDGEIREWNGADLAVAALAPIEFLPVFGCDGYVPLGFSTILGAEPKAGKTTLLKTLLSEWLGGGRSVLYLTEESDRLWKPRLNGDPESWRGLTLLPAYEAAAEYMLERIRLADEDIIVIDTARAVIRWGDENDNAGVERTLRPWIQAARSRDKTLVVLHHARKGGGPLLEALAGAHSLVGAFDQVLVLKRDEVTKDQAKEGERPNKSRRWLSGWGRFGGVPHLMYTLEAGSLLLEGRMETAPWE